MGKEKGAIVVEATIAFTAFIFAIFTILSIVNICFIQAKIAISLNTAAKDISQYSYLYYALGVDGLEAKLSEGTEEYRQLGKDTIDGIGEFVDSISDASNSAQSADFENMIYSIQDGKDNVDSLIKEYADRITDDPEGFVIGMGKMAVNDGIGKVKSELLAQVFAKSFMKKNLKSNPSDNPDGFLKQYNVVDGLDGLSFDYSSFLANGTSNQIQLVVTYDVRVVRLLGIDFKFKIRQCSKTTAWGNGVSVLPSKQNDGTSSTSVWDMDSFTERGRIIVAKEKEKYKYTSTGNGFDAYNNENGANEFITITSVNTHDASYQTSDGIKRRLAAAYNSLYSTAESLDENITVQDQNGQSVTISSNTENRTYRVVLAVPDDADLSLVAQAVNDFKATHPGVEVSVRQGYGSPSNPGTGES